MKEWWMVKVNRVGDYTRWKQTARKTYYQHS